MHDVYGLSPWASGIHIRQNACAHVITITYSYSLVVVGDGRYMKFSFEYFQPGIDIISIQFLDLNLAIEQYFCRLFMLIITLCLITSKANIT